MLPPRQVMHALSLGPQGAALPIVVVAAEVVLLTLLVSIVVVPLQPAAFALALAITFTLLVLVLLLLTRLRARSDDLRALVSLEHGMARAGYQPADFFTEAAAASPTLALLHFKTLLFIQPTKVLELGSGQSTKLLSAYKSQHPGAHIFTLEQDLSWLKRLAPEIQHDYGHSPLTDRQVSLAHPSRQISTRWYVETPDLRDSRFDYILVDGPDDGQPGTVTVPYARAGILDFLPGCGPPRSSSSSTTTTTPESPRPSPPPAPSCALAASLSGTSSSTASNPRRVRLTRTCLPCLGLTSQLRPSKPYKFRCSY